VTKLVLGRYVQFPDGRKGLVYNNSPVRNGKVIIYLVDDDMNPLLKDGREVTLIRPPTDFTIIGFFD
jgi:hypothetical protein